MFLEKAQKFCDYQERYQQEVRDKLYSWGAKPDEIEQILCQLVEQNYIDEERFARAFARGKFRIKHWGKNKIRQELKFRKISEYCIKQGLLEISDDEYRNTLKNVIDKKYQQLKPPMSLLKQRKIFAYALSRGFESDLIRSVLNEE